MFLLKNMADIRQRKSPLRRVGFLVRRPQAIN